jgi:hypothetical protein
VSDQWYFAHPHTAQSRGDKLMEYVSRMSGKQFINPFHQGENQLDPIQAAHHIVVRDLELIRSCKGLLAWYPRFTGGSLQIGTSMEVFFARHACGIPVVLYANPDAAQSPWLVAHGTVCTTVGGVLDELKKYG